MLKPESSTGESGKTYLRTTKILSNKLPLEAGKTFPQPTSKGVADSLG